MAPNLRSKYEKARYDSRAIKDFNQLKKIVNFPENQEKLTEKDVCYFANSSVKDGLEFFKLFNNESKFKILVNNQNF